jgi:hypothetical protein
MEPSGAAAQVEAEGGGGQGQECCADPQNGDGLGARLAEVERYVAAGDGRCSICMMSRKLI